MYALEVRIFTLQNLARWADRRAALGGSSRSPTWPWRCALPVSDLGSAAGGGGGGHPGRPGCRAGVPASADPPTRTAVCASAEPCTLSAARDRGCGAVRRAISAAMPPRTGRRGLGLARPECAPSLVTGHRSWRGPAAARIDARVEQGPADLRPIWSGLCSPPGPTGDCQAGRSGADCDDRPAEWRRDVLDAGSRSDERGRQRRGDCRHPAGTGGCGPARRVASPEPGVAGVAAAGHRRPGRDGSDRPPGSNRRRGRPATCSRRLTH